MPDKRPHPAVGDILVDAKCREDHQRAHEKCEECENFNWQCLCVFCKCDKKIDTGKTKRNCKLMEEHIKSCWHFQDPEPGEELQPWNLQRWRSKNPEAWASYVERLEAHHQRHRDRAERAKKNRAKKAPQPAEASGERPKKVAKIGSDTEEVIAPPAFHRIFFAEFGKLDPNLQVHDENLTTVYLRYMGGFNNPTKIIDVYASSNAGGFPTALGVAQAIANAAYPGFIDMCDRLDPRSKGSCLKPVEMDAQGYVLDPATSCWGHASCALFAYHWSKEDNDWRRLVIRVCPGLVQSVVSSNVLFVMPPVQAAATSASVSRQEPHNPTYLDSFESFEAALAEATGRVKTMLSTEGPDGTRQEEISFDDFWNSENRVLRVMSDSEAQGYGNALILDKRFPVWHFANVDVMNNVIGKSPYLFATVKDSSSGEAKRVHITTGCKLEEMGRRVLGALGNPRAADNSQFLDNLRGIQHAVIKAMCDNPCPEPARLDPDRPEDEEAQGEGEAEWEAEEAGGWAGEGREGGEANDFEECGDHTMHPSVSDDNGGIEDDTRFHGNRTPRVLESGSTIESDMHGRGFFLDASLDSSLDFSARTGN